MVDDKEILAKGDEELEVVQEMSMAELQTLVGELVALLDAEQQVSAGWRYGVPKVETDIPWSSGTGDTFHETKCCPAGRRTYWD